MTPARPDRTATELDLTQQEPEGEQHYADRAFKDLATTSDAGENLRANIQEAIRSTVTWIVLGLYVVIEWRMFSAIRADITLDNIDKAAAVLVTPLVGIVGTVLGFYFGNRSESRRR